MTGKDGRPDDDAHRRRRTEEIAWKNTAQLPERLHGLSLEQIEQTVHELRVHQVELKTQYEELLLAHAELDATRTRYFDLYDLAPVGYVTLSGQGLILEANLTATTLLGVARSAIVQQPFTRFILPEDRDIYYLHRKQLFIGHSSDPTLRQGSLLRQEASASAKASADESVEESAGQGSGQAGQAWQAGDPQAYELRMLRQDGTPFWTRVEATSALDAHDAPVCHVVLSDITGRKRAEDTLHREQEFARKVLDNIGDGVVACDANGTLVLFNRAAREWHGMDALALPPEEWGRHYDLYGPDAITPLPTEAIPLVRSFRGETVRDAGMTIIARGQPPRHILAVGCPFFDAQHNLLGAVVVMRDITERKRAEAEHVRLEGQLRQSQKMELVGRLAGGVAHDFNNMLGVILGRTEMAMAQVDLAQPLHAYLEDIRTTATRSTDLTRQLLAFARKQIVAPKVLDLNQAVAGMLKMLRRLIGEEIDLAWRPGAGVWPVRVDPSQIDQILVNVCVNAQDAIAGVGRLTIETENSTFDENYCAAHAGFVPGDYVRLVISDNGCGMDKDTLSHLFEPFFTTKGVGKGTGLGLATVYGIVKQNDGFINVYSEPGHGTTMTIYLPRHWGTVEQVRTEGSAGPLVRGHETILLVEDEPTILDLTTEVLEQQGYTVLPASTPGEAIRLARDHAGRIHLLMTDVVMPEMNGPDLAKTLLSLYPNLKRLFMSGYSADVIAHRGVLDEGVHFLQKPFSIKDLAATVREALDCE